MGKFIVGDKEWYAIIKYKAFLFDKSKTYMIILLIVLTIGTMIGVFINFYNSSISSSERYAKEVASIHSLEITRVFDELYTILTVFVSGIEKMRLTGHTDREAVVEQQKLILKKYPQILGIDVRYEPNAYDGRDAEYEGHRAYLNKGVFMSYVWRNGNDYITEWSYKNEEDGWYSEYKKSTLAVLSPLKNYKIGENTIKTVSLSMPIKDKIGFTIGAATIDYQLSSVETMVLHKPPFGGYAFVFADGQVLESSFPLIKNGETIEKISKINREIADAVLEAEQGRFVVTYSTDDNQGEFLLVANRIPLNIGILKSNWVYACVIPKSFILDSFRNSLLLCLVLAVFMLAIIITLLLMTFIPKHYLVDELAGIYNRKFINSYLPDFIKTANKKNRSLSLVMCDIDDFKLINDNYGHLVGDIVIKEFAKAISKNIHDNNDWAARYGGEEFLICLPNTSLKVAEKIVERLLNNVRSNAITTTIGGQDLEIKYTVSCGISSLSEYPAGTLVTMKDLIEIADNKLYAAKKAGKNRFVS